MSIATPFSEHPQLRSPKTASPLRGHLCVLGATARTRRSREGSNAKTWENGGAGDTAVGSRPQRRWCERGSDTTMKRLHLLGKTKEHLPYTACARRYPSSAPTTHEFAAKAAAVYFAKHRRESSTRLCGWQVLLSEKRVGAPAANSASEQIPLQLKPHR